jgi:Tfp pilus assembly protein PilO
MAVLPQDKRGQMELVFTIVAAAVLYFAWAGTPIGGVPGVSQLAHSRDSLSREIDSIQTRVDQAKRLVRQGTVARVERNLAEYRATLDMMRQLVPAGPEMPNLFDDITSRAKVRGANVVNMVPAVLESSAPFDIQRARVQVQGNYDQLGEYLSDISSLPRIIVPYDIHIQRVQAPSTDTSLARRNLLVATFQIKTYVKPQVNQNPRPGQPRPGAAPAGPPQRHN